MTSAPWMKWYPSDWRGERLLRACLPLSRYVWMEMLGLMHEADPYGHLVLGGRAMDYVTLSQMIAVDLGDVKRAVKELEAKGVFSRTDDGVIFSRRMVRDREKEEIRRQNGAKGGNPTLKSDGSRNYKNQAVTPRSDNRQDKPQDNREDKPQKPEARSQSPDLKQQAHQPEPREAAPRTKVDYDRLDQQCREAGDVPDSRSPAFDNLAPIIGLLDAGYDLERDILPSLRRQARRATEVQAGSWSYFVKGIIDDKRKRGSAQAAATAVVTAEPSAEDKRKWQESAWAYALKKAAEVGCWCSNTVRREDVPAEFIAKWEAEQRGKRDAVRNTDRRAEPANAKG